MRISILLFKPRLRIPFYGLPTIEWNFYIQGITHNISNGFSIFRVIMDKRIENAMNELINTEIWSTGLYLSLQVYFEDERLPILSSWLNSQAQDNMNKVYQMMNRICHDGGCVAINEMKRDTHEWTTPLNALNELLEHEQYISCQVNTFLILCRNVNMSFQFFHQRAVCRPYICKYGIYGIITYPRQGKRTETTLFLTVMDLRLIFCKI